MSHILSLEKLNLATEDVHRCGESAPLPSGRVHREIAHRFYPFAADSPGGRCWRHSTAIFRCSIQTEAKACPRKTADTPQHVICRCLALQLPPRDREYTTSTTTLSSCLDQLHAKSDFNGSRIGEVIRDRTTFFDFLQQFHFLRPGKVAVKRYNSTD